MNTNSTMLPQELSALVHHVELNRAGWWDKALQRLVLAAIWLSDHLPTIDEIQETIQSEFRLALAPPRLSAALAALEKHGMLVRLNDDRFRIPDKERAAFESQISAAEKAASDARAFFFELVSRLCSELDPQVVWTAFETQFLGPLIKDVGANAYRLIAGERMVADKYLVDRFLTCFDEGYQSKLSELVTTFLDPKREEVRAHISRMLHARFCVEASGLSDAVIQKLNANVGAQIRFRVFVDTNFLFSLLGLHENPSNAAAGELQEVIKQLKSNPKIELFITPRTIEEAKSSIAAAKYHLSGIPQGRNFTEAALHLGFSGMAERFLIERLQHGGGLSAEGWFDPYLNDFVPIARAKGVELFNEKLDAYSMRQDVIDDINLVLKYEERLPLGRRKSYEKVAHDMILWNFVNDRRAAYIESPIDAQDWILTVDFRLIGFDEHKQRKSGSKVPLCLHPTSLIQLLQFWIPRTKEFEEAVLSSLRLPFLFQEFDPEAEKTSLKILKGLGRFSGSEDLPQETITRVVLNDGLRSRLLTDQTEEAELKLIRDALVDEMKARADAEANKAQQLHATITEQQAAISMFDTEKRVKNEEIQNLKTKVAEEETRSKAAVEKLDAQDAEINALKAKMQIIEDRRNQEEADRKESQQNRRALFGYVGLLALILMLAGIGSWQANHMFPWYAQILGPMPTKALVFVVGFIVCHLILESWVKRKPRMARLWPFRQVKGLRRFLWALVALSFAVGVVGNLYANRIQRHLDDVRPLVPASTNASPNHKDASK